MKRLLWCLSLGVVVSACLQPTSDDAGIDAGTVTAGGSGGGTALDGGGGGNTGGGSSAGGGSATGGGSETGGGEPGGGGGEAGGGTGGGPTGESCADAIPVPNAQPIDGGFRAVFRASPMSDDLTVSCAVDGGVESVFQFEVHETATIEVSLSAPGQTWVNAQIREGNCESGAELGCVHRQATGARVLRIPSRPPGTYFLTVEKELGADVDVTLSVARPFEPPTNDTCATVTPLQFVNGVSEIPGTTLGASSSNAAGDESPTCTSRTPGGSIGDVVFSYTLTQPQDVFIDMATSEFGSYFVRTVCGSGRADDELVCANANSPTTRFFNQQPGTYFLWFKGQSFFFNARVRLEPPTPTPVNASCLTPTVLFADGGVEDFKTGTTFGVSGGSLRCNGTTDTDAPPVHYRFDVQTTSRFEGVVRTVASDAGTIVPGLSVRSLAACSTDGGLSADAGLVGCLFGMTFRNDATLTVSSLEAGSYILTVAGTRAGLTGSKNAGPFELVARLLPIAAAPTNDDCATGTTLILDGGYAFVRGTTRGAMDDMAAMCEQAATPEVVYFFTTPSAPTDGGYSALALIRSENAAELSALATISTSCGGGAQNQLVCRGQSASEGPLLTLHPQNLAPGTTYAVTVGGQSVARPTGPFSLELLVGPRPEHDTCAGARPILLNSPQRGSFVGATNGYDDFVDGGACAAWQGPDLVYEFIPTGTRRYSVKTWGPWGVSVIPSVMQGSCSPAAQCWPGGAWTAEETPTTAFVGVAGEKYYILVDSTFINHVFEFYIEVN